jgi:hypothetical protein
VFRPILRPNGVGSPTVSFASAQALDTDEYLATHLDIFGKHRGTPTEHVCSLTPHPLLDLVRLLMYPAPLLPDATRTNMHVS